MADDGNYRESRWFTAWKKGFLLEDFILPSFISDKINQERTKIGVGVVKFLDCSYAPEVCEEMWIPFSPSIDFCMHGVEIIGNSSGSHFQMNKQERRYEIVVNTSKKNGGVFLYSNLIGCDGGRLYFDGGSFVTLNGSVLNEGKRFMLQEMEIITSTIDLNEISSYRNSIKSRCIQTTENTKEIPTLNISSRLTNKVEGKFNPFDFIIPRKYHENDELTLAPACWMWDYLRRSGASGFFLPLSGGADSSCVCIMVALLTRIIYEEIVKEKNEKNSDNFVLKELRKIVKDENYEPQSAKEICNLILCTCFMGTPYSSKETRNNAKNLAEEIGSYHKDFDITDIIGVIKNSFMKTFEKEPKFKSEGGTYAEDLALQNIQARTRMCISYLIASLANWSRDRKGFFLVLSSANLDEGIMGYLTKYDCSSADLNPIGSLSKNRVKSFLRFCSKEKGIKTVDDVLNLIPSAELTPQETGKMQSDEIDMGMSYEELSVMGKLRKDFRCGPVSMYSRLITIWGNELTKKEIYEKVKIFFRRYSINRHKMTTITPALHCESYSLDDNRYDLRQFLYNTSWNFQFDKIDSIVNSNVIKIN